MKKGIISTLIAVTLLASPVVASAAGVVGDFNGSGVASCDDFNVLRSHLMGDGTGERTCYDVNGDGVVNAKDLTALKKIIKPTHIVGDVNNDGVVGYEDWNLLAKVINTPHAIHAVFPEGGDRPLVDERGNTILDVDDDVVPYFYDRENADVNKNGYVSPEDFSALDAMIVPSGIKGDANSDGVVDVKDLSLIKRFISGENFRLQGKAADINDDDSIDEIDLLMLRRMLSKQNQN